MLLLLGFKPLVLSWKRTVLALRDGQASVCWKWVMKCSIDPFSMKRELPKYRVKPLCQDH